MIIIVKDDEDVFTVRRKRQAGHKVDQWCDENTAAGYHDGHDDDLKITMMLTLVRSVLNAVRNWVEMRHPSTSLSISKAARVGMVYPANNW